MDILNENHSLYGCPDKKTKSEALSLQKQLLSFDFIVFILLMKNIIN